MFSLLKMTSEIINYELQTRLNDGLNKPPNLSCYYLIETTTAPATTTKQINDFIG